MEVTVTVKRKEKVKTLEVMAKARYWEDSIINGVPDENGDLTPCRKSDMWCPVIDVETGTITNWEKGKKAEIHFKVCDAGSYYLKNEAGEIVASIEQDYVPKMMCPKENGYGDYIIMNIDENGNIEKWNPTTESFEDDGY